MNPRILGTALLSAVVLAVTGCGSSSNNDQGTALNFIGFFSEAGEGSGSDLPAGLTGATTDLSAVGVTAYLGVQSNLCGQTFTTQSALLSYKVAGADVNPPDTTIPLSAVLGPASSEAGCVTSLPGNVVGSLPNRTFAETYVVPPAIMSYINFNRAAIFGDRSSVVLAVRVRITGMASGGDRLDTNELTLPVIISLESTVNEPVDDGSSSSDEEDSAAIDEALF